MKKRPARALIVFAAILLLAACSSRPPQSPKTGAAPHYKVGDPYQVKGNWYYPKEDYSYDETGIASWYGEDFHNKKTANGELFNKNELTAAHHTLPLPSLARVTNLENGRSLVVRINDRGPFSGARIIDLSQRSAQLLGFEKQGTAKVRVQVLADESKAIADAMRRYGGPAPQPVQIASAAPTSQPAAPSYQPATSATASIAPVTSQPLEPPVIKSQTEPPLPATKAEAHAMLGTIKPVPEVIQLPVTGQNGIYIQAGAFTKPDNATRMQKKLAHLGKVIVANADVKGVRFYRVRLGPMADVAAADSLLNKVIRTGVSNARIIVD